MTPEQSAFLAALAQKLGVGIEHLWPILVAKARLDAAIAASSMGILGLGAACLCGKALQAFRRGLKNDLSLTSDAFLGWTLLMVISGVAACVLLPVALCTISSFIYPEAAALTDLLHK